MKRTLAVLALLAGCASPTAPFIPEGSTPFDPPAVYATWWAEVEKDAGIDGDMSGIRWFSVPESWYHPAWDKKMGGMWSRDRSIYLAEDRLNRRGSVKHEMLHDILGGDVEHRHPAFRTYISQ